MTQFTYEFDLDDDNLLAGGDDAGDVERLNSQVPGAAKKPRAKREATAKKTTAADKKEAQQQQQSQAQPKIDQLFNSSKNKGGAASAAQQPKQQAQAQQQNMKREVDLEAAIQNCYNEFAEGDEDARLKALLAADAMDDDDDGDQDAEFDVAELLGFKQSTTSGGGAGGAGGFQVVAEDLAPTKQEMVDDDDFGTPEGKDMSGGDLSPHSAARKSGGGGAPQQQQQQAGGKTKRTLFSAAVKTEADAAAKAATETKNSKQQQQQQGSSKAAAGSRNYAVSATAELAFDQALQAELVDVKTEVKLEAGVDDLLAATPAAASASASAGAKANVSASGRKLPPAITAAERSKHAPLAEDLNAAQGATLRNVYWLDAKEIQESGGAGGIGASSNPVAGCVLLFGRIAVRDSPTSGAVYKSVCVRVPITRSVLFLPSNHAQQQQGGLSAAEQDAEDMRLLGEVTQLCRRRGIDDRTFKFVKRRYAFEEPGVPTEETRWLKLRYSAAFPPLWGSNEQAPKFENIQNAFGVHRSLLELLLVKRRFEGPGFLDVTDATAVPNTPQHRRSLCDYEFTTVSQKSVFVLVPGEAPGLPAPPKLLAASIQLRTQLDPSGKHHEIFAATIAMCHVDSESSANAAPACTPLMGIRQHDATTVLPFELRTRCAANGLRNVRTFVSEGQLVAWVLDTLREHDPDVLVGHNIVGFTLGVLMQRYAEHKPCPVWSTVGRLNWRQMPPALAGRGGGNNNSFSSMNKGYWEKEVCAGRLLVDTYALAKEYHRTANYKLLSLAHELELSGVFGAVHESHIDQPTVLLDRKMLSSAPEQLCSLLGQDYNMALLAVRLTHKLGLVPLTKRLAAVAGTVWSRVLNGSRAERIEYLLLHRFHRLKFVTPDKVKSAFQGARRGRNGAGAQTGAGGGGAAAAAAREQEDDDADMGGAGGGDDDDDDDVLGGGKNEDGAAGSKAAVGSKAKFQGGRVLEPEVGLYRDYVLLLDFNSLYPSIIQEYNVCFTTVERQKLGAAGATGAVDRTEPKPPSRDRLICEKCIELPNADALYPCPHRCVLPAVIRSLVEGRKAVRALMKTERNPATLAQLEIRQKALKLTANSMYGCLGFQHSRFYAQKLAELVTQEGRRALGNTVKIVNSCDVGGRVRVIYGDTDSVMISTNEYESLDNVKRIAEKIRKEVNKAYTHLELGMDGVFRTLLLHKKKKYAALTVTDWQGAGRSYKQEVKGLEMVRRDWCRLSKEACKRVLDTALSTAYAADDEVVETIGNALERIADSILAGGQALGNFVIAKSIQRDPTAYRDAHTQPHVQVALRMKAKQQPVFPGDLIPYVICEQVYDPNAPVDAAAPATGNAAGGGAAAAASGNSPGAATGGGDAAAAAATGGGAGTAATTTTPEQKEKQAQQQQQQKTTPQPAKKQTAVASSKSLAARAWSEEEIREKQLTVDAEWYLANQIYPPVLRLCEHINGFTPAFLCDKLKLPKAAVGIAEDKKKNGASFRQQNPSHFAVAFKGATLEDLYPTAERFFMKCRSCGMVEPQMPHARVDKMVKEDAPELPPFINPRFRAAATFVDRAGVVLRVPWFVCPNKECKSPVFEAGAINNALEAQLHGIMDKYYKGGRSADDYAQAVEHFSYLWRLFEIPPHPMSERERTLWDRAARFVDAAGRFRTSEEVRRARHTLTQRGVLANMTQQDVDMTRLISEAQVIGRDVLQRVLAHWPCMLADVSHVFGTAPMFL